MTGSTRDRRGTIQINAGLIGDVDAYAAHHGISRTAASNALIRLALDAWRPGAGATTPRRDMS